jgi:hyperosmotically inducible periplasmic protein
MLKFAVFAAVVGLCCGCSSGPKSPDVKESIEKSLRDAGLKDVSVSQDREKGVVTLGGHVNSQEDKTRAESAAKGQAEGQVVANEIAIQPPGSASIVKEVNADQDAAIDKNIDAVFRSAGLKGIKHSTKNGVVTLTGSTTSEATRTQAETAAKVIENVQQVVNEIELRSKKATSAN